MFNSTPPWGNDLMPNPDGAMLGLGALTTVAQPTRPRPRHHGSYRYIQSMVCPSQTSPYLADDKDDPWAHATRHWRPPTSLLRQAPAPSDSTSTSVAPVPDHSTVTLEDLDGIATCATHS
jgi:hypothetical protein